MIGCSFTLAEVAVTAGLHEDESLQRLEQAIVARFVEEQADSPCRYRFLTPLDHEAVLGLVSDSRRARLGARAPRPEQ